MCRTEQSYVTYFGRSSSDQFMNLEGEQIECTGIRHCEGGREGEREEGKMGVVGGVGGGGWTDLPDCSRNGRLQQVFVGHPLVRG